MKKILAYLTVFTTLFTCNVQARDDVESMLFEPAPKITAAKKDLVVEKKTLVVPTKEDKPLLQPEIISDTEFGYVDSAFPEDEEKIISYTKPLKKEVNPHKSLTETIKETASEYDEEEESSPIAGTWVEKLAKSSFLSSKDDKGEENSDDVNLEGMVNNSKSAHRRSNASVFDISGVMLRMKLPQAEAAMTKHGFKRVSQKFEIPNFIKWRYEEQCRNAGVVGYERLANCVVKAAKANNHQYVESEKFIKYDTQEEVSINLTSNFTDNKIYRIIYQSLSTRSIHGNSPKVQYLRDIKVYDFWKRINQKYGVPDNREDIIWGMGGNKPYMKAATGSLLLEDPMLKELDYTRMSREDQKYINTNLYNF